MRLAALILLCLLIVPSASAQQVVNGEKAKSFFAQFENRSPDNLTIRYDSVPFDPTKIETLDGDWMRAISPADSLNEYRSSSAPMALRVDQNGRRYLEHFNPAEKFASRMGLDYWLLGIGSDKNVQISDAFPAALMANRVSFVFRGPDKVYGADGTVIDAEKNPPAFLKAVGLHMADYDQDDGKGLSDNESESNNWHFYFPLSEYWKPDPPYNVKFESLGNNFFRLTTSTQNTVQRQGAPGYGAGSFDPDEPELSAFEGDRFALHRAETRLYFRAEGEFPALVRSDPDGSTASPFDDGNWTWHNYGVSFWHEDDEVDLVAITPERPQGTNFVQLLLSTSSDRYLTLPLEIRNTATRAVAYRLSTNGFREGVPTFDLRSAGYLNLYVDQNENGVLDSSELANPLSSRTPDVPAHGTLKCMLRVDTQHEKFKADEMQEFSLTVNAIDPADRMSLKGASLHVHSFQSTDVSGLTKKNVFATHDPALLRLPANQAPAAIIRATVGGQPLASGATVTAGTQITLESTGTDPDGASFCYETIDKYNVVHRHCLTVGHKFYTPEGYSAAGAVLRYKAWRTGENKFLLQASDGYSRSFADFSVNVSEAANVNPVAYIDYPKANSSYPAGVPVVFGAPASEQYNHDPDGGPAGSAHGIVRFDWDFGDGTTATNTQWPAHTYAGAGSYNVVLRVTDNEGATAQATRALTVTVPNHAPAARIRVVDEAALSEFGLAEVTGADSTDSDGQDTIAGYRWSFTGPNGYTDLSNQVFVEDSPRYLFSTWYPGTYTVFLNVVDKWGAVGTTSRSFTVKPSDGTIRANVITASTTVGNRYYGFDLDPSIKKGWAVVHAGLSSFIPPAPLATIAGSSVVITSPGGLPKANNPVLPADVPAELAGVFSSAVQAGTGTEMFSIKGLPAGTYDVTAYMYDSSRTAPGTHYVVYFGNTKLEVVIPDNPSYQNYIAKGLITHPGGNLVIKAEIDENRNPAASLAGFVISPHGAAGTPQSPTNLRVVS